MADEIILIDTSILIDYYRKSDKSNSIWIGFVRQGHRFAISSITKYEVYSGATPDQLAFWSEVFQAISIIPFDEPAVDTAVRLNNQLRRKRKQIDLADLFIAATAVTHNLSLATLNRKHFERIEELNIIA